MTEVVQYTIGANINDLTKALRDAEGAVNGLAGNIEKALSRGGERGSRAVGENIERSLRRSEAGASRAATAVGTGIGRSLGAAIGTGLGAVLSGAAIKKSLEDVVKAGNLQQDTRLSGGQLAGLQLSGIQNGVTSDEMESALKKFTEVSKKAKDDAEEFYKALSNVGPSFAKAFETAPTQSERLRILSDALKSTTDEVKRAQLAQEAFGSDSERLISALGGGRDALAQYEQAARSLGLAVDEGMVSKARAADQTLNQLATVISTNLRAALVELGPVLANIAGNFGQFADAASRAIAAIGGVKYATGNVLREQIAGTEESIDRLRKKREAIADQPESAVDRLVGNTRDARRALVDKSISAEVAARREALIELAGRGEFSDPRDLRDRADTAGAIRFANSNTNRAFKARPDLKEKGGGGGGRSDEDKAEDRLNRYTEALQRQGDVLKAEVDTFGLSNAERKAAIELAKAQVDLGKLDGEAKKRVTEELTKAVTVNEQYRESLERLREAKEQERYVSESLSNAIGDIIVDGKNASDVLRSLVKTFARDAINALLSNSGSFRSGSGGGLFGSLLSGFGSLFGGGGGGLPNFGFASPIARFASGGELPRGFSLVGENGPELLRNSGSGVARVYPSGVSTQDGGGVATVHLVVEAPDINQRITAISQQVAVKVTQQGISANNARIPSMLEEQRAR